MVYHIIPLNDLKDHAELSTCDCDPRCQLTDSGDTLIIHNSYDGREGLELANEILQS